MSKTRFIFPVIITLLLLAGYAGLCVRLFFLHMRQEQDFSRRIEHSQVMERKLDARRGRIFDRKGVLLAADIARRHVVADPDFILKHEDMERNCRELAPVLNLPESELEALLNRPGRRYVVLKKFVSEEMVERIRALKLGRGVYFEEVFQRDYPQGPLMAHVIGFANQLGDGCAGIELQYDSELKGVPGRVISRKDARRREIYETRSEQIDPEPGADVYLTLDVEIQHAVERALNEVYVETEAQGVWAVVQRVRTGEILAMASVPAYNPNQYGRAPPAWLRNQAIGHVYEPGSTLKAVSVAAALNEGAVQVDEIIDCGSGIWYYAGRPLREYRGHAYGKITVAEVVKKSSNIGTAQIALKLGAEGLDESLRAFGFGRRLGCGLPGEEAGIFHSLRNWSKLSITRIPMGHEIAVTALQMVNAVNAIANDGGLMRPFTVRRVQRPDGSVLEMNRAEVLDTPIRRETAKQMREIMVSVTEEGGTARQAQIPGYTVAGKTGTATKVNPLGGYLSGHNVASFVGFLPAARPEISMIVVVDDPRGKWQTGGSAAAPAFRAIADFCMRYLGVAAEDSDEFYAMPLDREAEAVFFEQP